MAHAEPVVIGTTEFLPGFQLAGVRSSVLANHETVMKEIDAHKGAGVIILDGSLTEQLTAAQREQLETSVQPVIITLSKDGSKERERLKRSIMNTLGVDLLK